MGRDFHILHLHWATLAQLVEQLIRNEQVVGSNPMGGSTSTTSPIRVYKGTKSVMRSKRHLASLLAFVVGPGLLNLLHAESPTAGWSGPWEGDANGTRLTMEAQVQQDQFTGTIRDATGYTYHIMAALSGETATGTFTDPQTGAILQSQLTLAGTTLTLRVMEPLASTDRSPMLELTFYPAGSIPAPTAPTASPASLDPAMVGIWRRSESSADASSSFSYVVEWTLLLQNDGSFVQTSRSAGGNLGVTGSSEPRVIAQGKWKTENKILWVDTGTGFQPYVRYLVDPQNMMFLFQDDSRQLWSR